MVFFRFALFSSFLENVIDSLGIFVAIWAIADLHLALSVPSKNMNIFGTTWDRYMEKIEGHWKERVDKKDLVLIPGDISWAMKLEEIKIDLEWIDRLPGTKVMIKGNHDYWWSSKSKLEKILPPSCYVIQNDAFEWNGVSIGGSRLWDSSEYYFDSIQKQPTYEREQPSMEDEKIFKREVQRLELSLKAMRKDAKIKIVMTHYPPIGPDLKDSIVSKMLEEYEISVAVFGHLHNIQTRDPIFGKKNGVSYYLTAADYLNFFPLQIT